MAARTQPVDLGILLVLADQEFVRQLREAHEKAGFDDLGGSDGFVFRTLADGPRTVSHLAATLQISKQGAGQIVDDMERRGYVERSPDPHDGRARLVSLSPRGAQALAEARRFHRSYERRLVREYGTEPVANLRRLLEAMAGGEERTVNARFRALYL